MIFLLIVAFYFIKKTVKLNSYNKNMPELNPKPGFVGTDSCFPAFSRWMDNDEQLDRLISGSVKTVYFEKDQNTTWEVDTTFYRTENREANSKYWFELKDKSRAIGIQTPLPSESKERPLNGIYISRRYQKKDPVNGYYVFEVCDVMEYKN